MIVYYEMSELENGSQEYSYCCAFGGYNDGEPLDCDVSWWFVPGTIK